MKTVFSIGYEGRTVTEFVRVLKAAGVEIVADVRFAPLSRKPGFSKNVLAARLAKARIEYIHLRSCGNPDRGCTAKKYLAQLKKGTGAADLGKLIAGKRRVAVLCFERDPEECHRSLLLEHLGVRAADL